MIRLNVFVRVSETNREKAIEAAEVLAAHEKSPHFGKYVGIIQELAEMKLEKFEF